MRTQLQKTTEGVAIELLLTQQEVPGKEVEIEVSSREIEKESVSIEIERIPDKEVTEVTELSLSVERQEPEFPDIIIEVEKVKEEVQTIDVVDFTLPVEQPSEEDVVFEAPSIIQPLTNVGQNLGETVILKCQIIGEPQTNNKMVPQRWTSTRPPALLLSLRRMATRF